MAARNRVRLRLGAIKAFGEIWPLGCTTVTEVKVIVKEVLSLQDSSEIQKSSAVLCAPELPLSGPLTTAHPQFDGVFY